MDNVMSRLTRRAARHTYIVTLKTGDGPKHYQDSFLCTPPAGLNAAELQAWAVAEVDTRRGPLGANWAAAAGIVNWLVTIEPTATEKARLAAC